MKIEGKNLIDKIRTAGRYCRDREIRSKLDLFLEGLISDEIVKTCSQAGKAPRYYYYWWNRFRDSGFQISALKKQSRRPKRSPRKISDNSIKWIRFYRKKYSYNPEVISLYLEKEKGLRVSKSTVYRTLLREGMPRLKRGPKRSPKPIQTPPRRALQKRPQPVPKETTAALPHTGRILAKRFELLRPLGEGGGGLVYLARDQRAKGDRLALKLLPWKEKSDPALAVSLKNEFQILSDLQHAHLAKVFDFGTEGRELFFTSEWVEGPNILRVCREANLNTVFQLLVQILRGLDYLHAKGILHLDLKPQNILVTDPSQRGNLQIKLIDFGTAQWAKRGHGPTGDFVGTPPYSAPEMILQGAPSPASDIYSLGMVLHQIFGNRFPFSSNDPLEMMKEQIYGEPLPVTKLPPALPPDFARLLRQMVAREARERPQSVAEVLAALNDILGENFSLKGKNAPTKALEESEFVFHPELLDDLVQNLQDTDPQVSMLSAPAHMGKSFLLRKLKHRLQLVGRQPLWFDKPGDLKEFLLTSPPSVPLIADFENQEPDDWGEFFDLLENSRCPALLTTGLAPSPEVNAGRWFSVPPLSLESVSDFLSLEIRDFPIERLALSVYSLSRGIPYHFGILLQAMQEEGFLQWTQEGWTWVAEPNADFHDLIPRHEQRWQERLERIQEILTFTHLPLSAANLEGLLALEPGILSEKLGHWTREGRIQSKIIRRVSHFFLAKEQKPESRFVPAGDWAEQELRRLYDAGDFHSGVELIQVLREGKAQAKQSPKLALLSARHLVSAGYNQQAMEMLPREPDVPDAERGMYWEIRARARFNQGDLTAAQENMVKAETAYQSKSEFVGIARIQNLKALAFKRLQKFAEAESTFQNCIRLCAEHGELYIQALALMNLGIYFYDQGRFDQAKESYQLAFEFEKQLRQPVLSCKLRENWVNLLYHLGQSHEAEGACYDLLKTSIHYRYREQQAAALNYLSLLAGQRENPPLQLQYLNQALSILDPEVHRQLCFQTKLNRSYAHLALKKFVAAQLDAESALELAENSAAPQWEAMGCLTLAKVLRDRPQADLPQASKLFNKARMLIRENQIQQLEWEIEFERGLLMKRKGENVRAKNYFLSAKDNLQNYLASMPEAMRKPYLRNRQWDRIENELKDL